MKYLLIITFCFIQSTLSICHAQNTITLPESEYLKIKLDILSLQLNSNQIYYYDIGETSIPVSIEENDSSQIEFVFRVKAAINWDEDLELFRDNCLIVVTAIGELLESPTSLIRNHYEILGYVEVMEGDGLPSLFLIWKNGDITPIQKM